MTEIKLDQETLRLFALFEKVTRARARDVVEEEDRKTFVVDEGQVGKAVGRGAQNLKRLRDLLDVDIDVVGYAEEPEKFIRNIFHRFKVESVEFKPRGDQGEVAHVTVDAAEKGKAIGKAGRNVNMARTLAKRHHDIVDVVIE